MAENNQSVETTSYIPTYRVKASFKEEVMKAIGDAPYNQIASIMQAINVQIVDHNTLTQILNALGQFPYNRMYSLLGNVNVHLEQIIED